MRTTEAEVRSGVQSERFVIAGRLLALAEVIADEGEERGDSLLLHHLAVIVATRGMDYGRGWIEGAHHIGGVRMHRAWTLAGEILGVRSEA